MSWNRFIAPNLGLLFYKHIYKEHEIFRRVIRDEEKDCLTITVGKDEKPFDPFYGVLYEQKANEFSQITNDIAEHKFPLMTTYPGLLLGSGYMHETKATGDFKLGFYFDHTTGQPVLPGSSVKGVCRSLFEVDLTDKGKNFSGPQSVKAVKFVFNELLESEKDNPKFGHTKKIEDIVTGLNETKLKALVSEMFGSDKINGKDIFFDAVLDMDANGERNFLASDFITPHHHDLLKNPTPLQFLKVKSNVVFEFRFLLKDGLWSADIKELFFKQVLKTFGIGAKTHIGYGLFKNP